MTLIERLRDYINNTDDCGLRVEAADELERQERRIKELEAELRNASIWLTDRTLVKKQLAAATKRITELEADYRRITDMWAESRDELAIAKAMLDSKKTLLAACESQLAALRQKIEDAPVVAWLHSVRRDSDVMTDAVKHLWDRVPVAVGREAQYTIPLIRKEDLK